MNNNVHAKKSGFWRGTLHNVTSKWTALVLNAIEKRLCVSQAYYALWLCKQFSSMESDDVSKSKPFQPHSRVSSAVNLYFMRKILFVLPKACLNTRISKSIYSVGNSTTKWKIY